MKKHPPFSNTFNTLQSCVVFALSIGMAIAASAQTTAGDNEQQTIVRDALTVQKARNASVADSRNRKYYVESQFDLAGLPNYQPASEIAGPIRIWASDMWGGAGFQERLDAIFRRFHPEASLVFEPASPSLTFAALLTGLGDVAIARRMMWVDLLAFQRKFDRDPLVIRGMTGWHVNPPFAIAVHRDNPIAKISLDQLDRIFGAERDGGWSGTSWNPAAARGPDTNIRTWGQLGLADEWADRPIDVYGYNLQYLFAPRFSDDVLKGGGKWNERLRQFTIHANAEGKLISVDQQMADAVAANRYAIAYYSPMRGIHPDTRHVPIELASAEVIALNADTVRDHSYPLFDNMWFYANRIVDGTLDPKVREFLSFVLSREVQEEVARDTTMLPLTAELIEQERRKLN